MACPAPARATRWCTCAGSWCTPRRTPPAQAKASALKLAKAAEELDKLVRTAGTRFHPAARSWPPASRRSPPNAGSGTTCALPSPPGQPASPSWPGTSTRSDRRRSRRGRLVRAADQPDPRPGQPGPGLPPLQRPARRRTPLRRVQGPPRRRPDLPGTQPAHHRPDHRDLPGPADLLPGRTAGPPGAGPARRDDTGLPGYGPAPARPTGKTIFRALADLRLIPAHDGNPATIPKPAGVQARLLDLLNIDISLARAGSPRKTPCAKNGTEMVMIGSVQQPRRATPVLGRHPRTHYAALFDHEQGRAGSLHPDGRSSGGQTWTMRQVCFWP